MTNMGGSHHHLGSNLRVANDIEPLAPHDMKAANGGGGSGSSDTDREDEKVPLDDTVSIGLEMAGGRRRVTFSQILTSISVSLVSLVIGYISGYTSPAGESLKQDLEITDTEFSWIGSLMPLSAMAGGVLGGQLIDYCGRRRTIALTNLLFLLGWLLCAVAASVNYVYASRVLIGFSVGVASLALPVYLGETIQPEVRGTLGLLPTAFGNTGILVCYAAGSYLNWQQLAWLGVGLSLPFVLLMFCIRESPRWYVSKQRDADALKTLSWLRSNNLSVQLEYDELLRSQKEASAAVESTAASVLDLFDRAHIRPVLISLGLMFFQQMSGINAVIFYTTRIFSMAGSTIDENLCTIIVGLVNFASTFIATVLIDRLGRKVLLHISNAAMIVTLAALGTYFYLTEAGVDVSSYGWLPLLSFVVYVLGFSLGFGPIPWLMMGEILPSRVRGTAASLATAFNWTCTFVVTKTFVDVLQMIGAAGTFWMFGGFCLLSTVFVCAFVPETRGKSLEDIERKFAGRSNINRHDYEIGSKVVVAAADGAGENVRRVSSVVNFKPSPFGS